MSREAHRSGVRRGRKHSARAESSHRDRWLLSYADLVTLLLALFVVLYAAADHDRARAIAQYITAEFGDAEATATTGDAGGHGVLPGADSLVEARRGIERALAANDALRAHAQVAVTERGLVVSLAEAGFFAPGEATVRDDARPLVDALADSLRESNMPLRVEGHTDSTPISTARYPSNWELSAARASAVLARLVARGFPPAQLSVAGYAGEQPVADNAMPEGRALNRRVDLVILRARN